MKHLITGSVAAILTSSAFGLYALLGGQVNPSPPIVAREPGLSYNVLAFCNDPATKVGVIPMTDAPQGGTRYIALRGTETVNWPDSPVGRNPIATHTWIAVVPNPANPAAPAVTEQRSEAVEITKDAADCLQKRAK